MTSALLCREADALFWMGRYLERAEATARLVDVQYHAALESSPAPAREAASLYRAILQISGDEAIYEARYGAVSERDLIEFMVFDLDQPNSVVSCIRSARINAQNVREIISSEMWEAVNTAFLNLLNWDVDKMLGSAPHAFLVDVRNGCHLFYGLAERTLLVGEAGHFLKTGIFLERAGQMARLTDVLLRELTGGGYGVDQAVDQAEGQAEDADVHGWIACLKSASGFEAFRKTYPGGITPNDVLSFLVLDWEFPSSIHHAVSQVERGLRAISGSTGCRYADDAERLVGRLHADLSFLTVAELREQGLHEFLQGIPKRCAEIGGAIKARYLRG
jgi:uncharacterized alpha-E superfamily protein